MAGFVGLLVQLTKPYHDRAGHDNGDRNTVHQLVCYGAAVLHLFNRHVRHVSVPDALCTHFRCVLTIMECARFDAMLLHVCMWVQRRAVIQIFQIQR